MDSPGSRHVTAIRQKRKRSRSVMQRTNDECWRLLETSKESLQYVVEATSGGGYALLTRQKFSSPSDLFRQFLSAELIEGVLTDISRENPEVFVIDSGNSHFVKMKVTVQDVYQSLACRAFIHGEQAQAGKSIKQAFKTALAFLQQHSPVPLNGFRKTYHIERKFHIKGVAFSKGRYETTFSPP